MNPDLSFTLRPEEKVIFATKSTAKFLFRKLLHILLGLILMAVGILMLTDREQLWWGALFLFGGLALLYLVGLDIKRTRNTYYQLTTQRAMVIELFGGKSKPTVFSFPLDAYLIQHVKHHRNRTTDYLFAQDNLSLASRGGIGFYNLSPDIFTNEQWSELGLQLPAKNTPIKKLPAIKRPATWRHVVGCLIGSVLLGGVTYDMLYDAGADLHLFGQEKEAIVIAHEEDTERRGKRREVSIYYPVVIYEHAGSLIKTTALAGYRTPVDTGDTITILADPHDESRVIPAEDTDESVFSPVVFALCTIGCFLCFVGAGIRIYRNREQPYHEISFS